MNEPLGKPQMFKGTSAQPIKYQQPPVEILEAVTASIGMYVAQLGEGTPQYVIDASKDFVASLERWTDEIKHPHKAEAPLTIEQALDAAAAEEAANNATA